MQRSRRGLRLFELGFGGCQFLRPFFGVKRCECPRLRYLLRRRVRGLQTVDALQIDLLSLNFKGRYVPRAFGLDLRSPLALEFG